MKPSKNRRVVLIDPRADPDGVAGDGGEGGGGGGGAVTIGSGKRNETNGAGVALALAGPEIPTRAAAAVKRIVPAGPSVPREPTSLDPKKKVLPLRRPMASRPYIVLYQAVLPTPPT